MERWQTHLGSRIGFTRGLERVQSQPGYEGALLHNLFTATQLSSKSPFECVPVYIEHATFCCTLPSLPEGER